MLLSVIMPIYNAEKYMYQSINSVLVQTYDYFELILVNDGSSDDSGKIADALAKEDSRIISLHQENAGPGSARNQGILNARGEYILFIDSDDQFEINAFELIYNQLNKEPVDFMCFGYKAIKENIDKELITEINPNYNLYENSKDILDNQIDIISKNYFPSVCNKVYKRSVVENNMILMRKDMKIGEDLCFNLEMLDKSSRYCEFNLLLYKYIIQNPNSIISKYNPNKDQEMLKIHNILSSYIKGNTNINNGKKFAYIRNDFIKLCFSCFMDMFRKECDWSYKEKIGYIDILKNKMDYKFSISDNKYLSTKRKIINFIFIINSNYLIYITSYVFFIMKFKSSFYKSSI